MRSGLARGIGVLSSGVVLAQIISVLTLPLVSRLYEPAEFGEFVLLTSTAAIAASLSLLGLPHAVVSEDKAAASRQTMTAGLVLTSAAVVLMFGLALVAGAVGFRLGSTLPWWSYLALIAVMAILTGALSYFKAAANREGANRLLFTNSIIASLATLAITVPLGFLGAGTAGLVAGSAGALILGILQIAWRLRLPLPKPSFSKVRRTLRRNNAFIKFQYPADLLETVSTQLPRQAISGMFGPSALGQFSMSERVMAIPMRLMGVPISTVFFREAAALTRAGASISRITSGLCYGILTMSIVPVLILLLWARPIFEFVLGDGWGLAGTIASIVVVQQVFLLIRVSVLRARIVLDRQRLNLGMSSTRVIVEVTALVSGALIQGDVIGALVWFAVASTAFLIFDIATTLHLAGARPLRFVGAASVYVCLFLWARTLGS